MGIIITLRKITEIAVYFQGHGQFDQDNSLKKLIIKNDVYISKEKY